MWQENTCAGVSFLVNLQAEGLQLYLNETPAQVLSYEFYLISQNTYFQNSCEMLFLLFFLKFYSFLCDELQGNEDQRFGDYVNGNEFKKNTAKFYVMWRVIYFHEKQQLPVFRSAKYSSSCIVLIVFSA